MFFSACKYFFKNFSLCNIFLCTIFWEVLKTSFNHFFSFLFHMVFFTSLVLPLIRPHTWAELSESLHAYVVEWVCKEKMNFSHSPYNLLDIIIYIIGARIIMSYIFFLIQDSIGEIFTYIYSRLTCML